MAVVLVEPGAQNVRISGLAIDGSMMDKGLVHVTHTGISNVATPVVVDPGAVL